MGNSQGQLKSSRFENALHMSIEQSLRSNSATPHPLFSQLYLEEDIKVGLPEVLPVPSDNGDQERQIAVSPRGGIQQEAIQRSLGSRHLAPRLVSSLPAMPGPIPLVHGPLQRVVLPPSSLGPSYHPQRFILPGGFPPPHAMPPVMCTVPSPPSLRHIDRPPSHHHRQGVPPREDRSPRGQRSSVDTARPAMLGGCQDVGFCKAGTDIRLSTIHDKQVHLPGRFVLVGVTSPYLPEDTLVAAVDERFLPHPGDTQALHLDGFSGNCIGCGKKGFRYFSEFAHHINLKVMPEAKRENYLRYYIILRQGQMVMGALIPWQDRTPDQPQKRTDAEEPSWSDGRGSPPVRDTLDSQLGIEVKEEEDPQESSSKPPKKRHRFHSLDDEKPDESPVKRRMSSHPSSEILPPPSNGKDAAFIPANLADRCSTKVALLECCGTLPPLHGHVGNVSVITHFREGFSKGMPPMTSPQESLNVNTLNLPTRILLLMKYLLQLGSKLPYREGFDAALTRAVTEAGGSSSEPSSMVTLEQLPSLAKLCANASRGSAQVIVAQDSLAVGLTEALRNLASLPSDDRCPDYTFVICTSDPEQIQFCTVVAGPLQARALIEGSRSSGHQQIITEDILLLATHFSKSCQGIKLDDLMAGFSTSLDGKVFLPFNAAQHDKVDESVASGTKPIPCGDIRKRDPTLRPHQIQAAMKVLSRVCAIADLDRKSLDLGRFTEVGLLVVVPPSKVLYEQTVDRLHSSKILLDVGLDATDSRDACRQFVMRLDDSPASQSQLKEFAASVTSAYQTLFVVVLDQVHAGFMRSARSGFREVANSPNVLFLHVSSAPYSLQTRNSPVPRENEIYMEEQQDAGSGSLGSRYFGIGDYRDSLQWTSQTPLLQYDETFELMAESILKSYPELHSRMVRTYLLVRQYSVAILNAISEQNLGGTTDTTSRIVQDLLATPLTSEHGHGPMILLRIPSPQLAALAHQRLRQVRDGLGLRYRFEVILAALDRAMEVDQHFLQRLQVLRGLDSSWTPVTFEDLEGLPCILILSDMNTMGETMPRSLKVVDLRLVNEGMFDLEALERELGLACTHVTSTPTSAGTTQGKDHEETAQTEDMPSRKPDKFTEENVATAGPNNEAERNPPLVLLSKQAFMVLKGDYSETYASGLPPCPHTRWISGLRPLLTSDNSENRSNYLRKWTEPVHDDAETVNNPRRLLLSGPPQFGKTGAYLHFCRVLRHMLVKLQEVEVEDDNQGTVSSDPAPSLGGPPDPSLVQRMTFDPTIHQERYKQCSLIWHNGLNKQDLDSRASSSIQDRQCSTVVLQSTKLTAHNSFHCCQECQPYCTGDGGKTGVECRVHEFRIRDPLFGEVGCQFIIPRPKENNFVFDHETGKLRGVRLPVTGGENRQAVKSPLFMLMRNPPEQSLVNLHHVMDGCEHTQVLVCREKDSEVVREQWPCHTVLVLPSLANSMGGGGVKYFVQRIAMQNLAAERRRYQTLGMDPGRVWPFILIMEDCLLSWRRTEAGSEVEVSLRSVIDHVEALPDVIRYAVLGIDQWNTRSKVTQRQCLKSIVDNMIFLNVGLMEDVQYNPFKFFNEDIDLSWRVNSRQLLICKLPYLQVMVKSNLSGPHPPDVMVHPSTPSRGPITADRFLLPPGTDDCPLLLAPPHFLVERYLAEVAFKLLLATDVDLVHHPVLAVEGYVNLGPRIPVCLVSSAAIPGSDFGGISFSGLVIDTCLHPIPPRELIQQCRFIDVAQLVVVSPDVDSARRAVSEMNLESNWQLEMLQTATARGDGPVSVIRGTFIAEPGSGLEEQS